jgi:hypothetical protein
MLLLPWVLDQLIVAGRKSGYDRVKIDDAPCVESHRDSGETRKAWLKAVTKIFFRVGG